jgi:circadian clock protein KaiC
MSGANQLIAKPRISTGITGLDTVLHGGLPADRIYLVEGDPGTGKTTLAMQFILDGIASGGRSLYITLSETEAELQAMADSHGWSLAGVEMFELIPAEANLDPSAQYTFFHTEEVELGETVKTLLERVEQVQPTHLVIDSLAELRLLAKDGRRYRRQVLALKNYFASKKITVYLLDDRTSEMMERQLHSIVHGVISLQRMPREYGRNRRRLEMSKIRGSDYIDGFHDYIIERGGLAVFPRLQAARHRAAFERGTISCGVENLDSLLGGGLDLGSASLFIGAAGTGKTTLAMKYATAAVQRSDKVAMFAFDEALGTLLARASGLNLPITECMDRGCMTVQQVDPAELSPGEFAWNIRKAVEDDGVRMVIIDSLNGYLNAMPEERFLALQMHEILSYLNQHGVVTILILSQQGVLGQFGSPVDLSYLADTIVLLRFFEAAGEIRRAISVTKKRNTGHERLIREMQIGGPDTIQVGDPLTQFHGVLTGVPRYKGAVDQLFPQTNESSD